MLPVVQLDPAKSLARISANTFSVLSEMQKGCTDLKASLREVPTCDPQAEYLKSWYDCVSAPDLSEFPAELLESTLDYSDDALRLLELPEEYVPPVTQWSELAPAQVPPLGFEPSTVEHLLTHEAICQINQWIQRSMIDLARMQRLGEQAGRKYNKVLALGQDAFLPEARGIVWDLRRVNEGVIVPLDFRRKIDTHWDLEYIWDNLKDYPDQELVSMLLQGVQYKADLDLQIVLLPHLISFGAGCKLIQKEVVEYTKSGWYSIHDFLPFLPMRNIPRGSTPRPGDAARPRPTSDGGAPRNPVFDSTGVPVVPLNVSSKGEADEHKWVPEVKPRIREIMTAIALFRYLAFHTKQQVLIMTDDEKVCFNQFALSPEELWKSNTLFRDERTNKPMWASERVMPFGIFPASGIAQRKAYAQMALVWIEFDRLEESVELCGFLSRWKAQREELGLSTRLAFGRQYTDDVCVVVLGTARMVRFLRAWHAVISRFNILMAPPKKRQLGCAATWLGAILAPATGAVTTPMSKRLRAIEMLRLLLSERLTLGQLAKLNGLLEHLCDVFCLSRKVMFHMYEPMQRTGTLHPDFEFVPSKHLIKQTAAWLLRLAKTAGSRCGQMLLKPWKATESTQLLHWYSDAAKEGCGMPGLGGWYSGYWWQWILPEGHAHLSIPVLEFMAVLVNMVVFGRLVLRGFHDQAFIVMHIDASASVIVLASGAPKSQPMQLVWEAISERPEYQKLKRRLGAAHTFGPANLMADAASRNKVDVIERISAQMRINSVQLPVPSSVKELISKISVEILEMINQDEKVQRADTPDGKSATPNLPKKRSLAEAELYVAEGQANNPDSASFADVPRVSSTMVVRPLSACELSLDVGQANTPDSASFVMRKLLQQLGLSPVEMTASGRDPGGMSFRGTSTFRVDVSGNA